MKNKLSIKALMVNCLLAFLFAAFISISFEVNPVPVALGIVGLSTAIQFFVPTVFSGKMMAGLQTEIWVPGIKENPVPDHSFVTESVDLSEYVNNNTLHLAEAGVEPGVHEDFFASSDDPLPFANVADIPNEVVLHTYSTEQTRHRNLQEVELQYDRRASVINRHRTALGKNIGKRAAHAWAPSANGGDNRVSILGSDSIIDAIIDMEAFYADRDILEGLNICFTPQHLAKLKKEDYKLYKQVLNEKLLYGMKVHRYSQNPLFTAAGVKKPYGAAAEAGDIRGTFVWVKDEVFRCFGDTEMYATLRDSGTQSDTLSFAQRALVGKIRANAPKYLGAIL